MHEDPADWMGRLMASPDTSTHPFAQAYTNEYNAIRGMSILEVLQQTLLEVGQREHQVLLGVRRQAAAIRKNRIVVLSKDVQATAQRCRDEGRPGGGSHLCVLHINGNGNGTKVHKCGCAPQNTQQLHFSAVHVSAGIEAKRPLDHGPPPAALAEVSPPLEVPPAKTVCRRLELESGCEASAARIKLNELAGAPDGSLSPAADCAILPTCSVTPSTSVRKRQASTDTAMSLDVRCRVNAEDSQPGFARCVREWARFCGESRRTCLGPNAPTGLSHRVIQRKPDLDREKEIRQEQMTWNRKSSCCIRYQPGAAHTAGLPTQIHEKTKRQATKASINMLAEQKAEHERARASERETHRARCNSDMEEQSGGNTEESDYANERDSDHERVSDGEGDANSDNEGQCGRNYEESDNENEDEREQEPEQEQELA